MMRKRLGFLCGAFLFGGLLQCASAAALSGTFNMGGTITVTGFSTITWNSTLSPGFAPSMFTLSATNLFLGGVPTSSENGENGISTLNNPPEVVGSPGFSSTPFITFLVAAGLPTLDINFINPGFGGTAGCTASAAPGETCTFAGSLFTFTDDSLNPDTSDAKFNMSGVTSDGLSTWNAIFTSQFPETYQTLLSGFGNSTVLSNSYSATVTVQSIPEPATWLLVGLGLGVVAFRKYKQARLT